MKVLSIFLNLFGITKIYANLQALILFNVTLMNAQNYW